MITFQVFLELLTRGDQKVQGKVLLNRIAFIDCNENSQIKTTIHSTNLVSFEPVPVLMVVKIIWSTVLRKKMKLPTYFSEQYRSR